MLRGRGGILEVWQGKGGQCLWRQTPSIEAGEGVQLEDPGPHQLQAHHPVSTLSPGALCWWILGIAANS